MAQAKEYAEVYPVPVFNWLQQKPRRVENCLYQSNTASSQSDSRK